MRRPTGPGMVEGLSTKACLHSIRAGAVNRALLAVGIRHDPALVGGHIWERLGCKVYWTGERVYRNQKGA